MRSSARTSNRCASPVRGGSLWSLVLALALSVNAAMAQTAIASIATRPAVSQGKSIRVLLATGPRMELDFPDGASIYTLADGALVGRINPLSSWSMTLAASRPALQLAARNNASKFDATANNFVSVAFTPRTASPQVDRYCLPLTASAGPDSDALDASQGYLLVAGRAEADTARSNKEVALFALGGKLYRGALILRPTANNGISAINVLDLEDYLLSVVPSEVPSLWPAEVLKAQAVAARSYAVANLGKHRAEGYDVKATVDDQVYRGVIAEAEETNNAVAQTNGLVLKHNNQVISAFFHSTSGGSTELAENVWGKPLPYLKSVVDYDDASPQFNWKKTVNTATLAKSLGEDLLGVLVVGRHPGDSRRVKDVLLVGKTSARLMSGADLRRTLNLPSTQFSLYQSDDMYIFSGRGSGHGLGLSQWGAKALADNGYNALQILSYYYKDVTIESLTQ